jgi:hypothetical protein
MRASVDSTSWAAEPSCPVQEFTRVLVPGLLAGEELFCSKMHESTTATMGARSMGLVLEMSMGKRRDIRAKPPHPPASASTEAIVQAVKVAGFFNRVFIDCSVCKWPRKKVRQV